MKTRPPKRCTPTIKPSSVTRKVSSTIIDTTLTNQRHISDIFKSLALHGDAISRLNEVTSAEGLTSIVDDTIRTEHLASANVDDEDVTIDHITVEKDKTSSVSISEFRRRIAAKIGKACAAALPKSSN